MAVLLLIALAAAVKVVPAAGMQTLPSKATQKIALNRGLMSFSGFMKIGSIHNNGSDKLQYFGIDRHHIYYLEDAAFSRCAIISP